MYCKNCGTELTGKFCSNCGTKAEENIVATVEEVETEASVAEEIVADPIVEETPALKKSIFNKVWFWLAVAGGTIVLLLIVILVGTNSKDSSSGSSSSSSGSSYDSSSSSSVTTSSSAISKAKDAFYLDQRIASALGFKQFYQPDFGTASADENYDGSWTVTLKGEMSGYIDDYHSDFESRKFEATVKVSSSGFASVSYVRRAY